MSSAEQNSAVPDEYANLPFQPRPVTLQRRYPAAPMVGTGIVILDDAGRALLVRSGKAGRRHPWGIPGGLLDLGESLADGARREVAEECGVRIALRDQIHIFELVDWDAAGVVEYHFVVIDFWADYVSGEPTPGDDVVEVAWCALEQMSDFDLMEVSQLAIRKGHARWQAARTTAP